MKLFFYTLILFLSAPLIVNAQTFSNNKQSLDKQNPWSQKELIQPSELAALIANPKAKQALIFNIGVVDDIKGAKNMGGASEKENLEKLKKTLKELPKGTFLVIYCGCCPFEKCPNIRPAFNLLKSMGFSNGRLLDLPINLKQNWIDKGYPIMQQKAGS